jgi:hypothetical protein
LARQVSEQEACQPQAAEKNDVYYSKSSVQLRKLNAEHMAKINAEVQTSTDGQLISDFWEQTYLKWVEANKKPSTLHSYKQIWDQHLKKHFGKTTLAEYRTSDATAAPALSAVRPR